MISPPMRGIRPRIQPRIQIALALVAIGFTASVPVSLNAQENPLRIIVIGAWGGTSAVYPARDGSGNMWVAERCGQNSCVGKEHLDTVFLFGPSGNLLTSFGAGMIVWPHGIHVDAENDVWVTDARGHDGSGHQVCKFSSDGELLLSLGKAGVAGTGNDELNQPSDVLVAPWILRDFRSPMRQLGDIQDGWNRKGVISSEGDRKLAFDVLKEHYPRKPK